MIETQIAELIEAIKANTAVINAVLAKTGPTQPEAATAPAEDKPAKAKKEAAPVAEKPKAEPAAPAKNVVTPDELATAIRARLKEGESFKSQFAALRIEFNVSSITELTDENRGDFLERVAAIECL